MAPGTFVDRSCALTRLDKALRVRQLASITGMPLRNHRVVGESDSTPFHWEMTGSLLQYVSVSSSAIGISYGHLQAARM